MKTFDVYVGADGFSWVVLTATGPDLGQIALAPLTTDYVWSGIFQDPSLGPGFNERLISFDTHHAGPVTLSIHAGCSTAGTYEPLVLSVYPAGELDITRVLLGASLGSEVDRDASVERILPPAAYSAHMLFVGQNRGTCPWSMTIRHPV